MSLPPCTENEIFDALNAQLATLPNLDTHNVAWLGKTYVPEAETPFIETSMPGFTGRPITAGTAVVYEWKGIYQVKCNWPIGGGLQDALVQIAQVRALFPNGTSLVTTNGYVVRCYAAMPKPPLDGNAWVSGIAQVPWFLHEPRQ